MATGNNEMNKTIDNSTLVFHLNQDLFTYSTFNTYTNTFQTIKSYQIDSETNYEDNIENIIKNDTTLKLKHTKTLGTIISEQSTFIPDLFFNKYVVIHKSSAMEVGANEFIPRLSTFNATNNIQTVATELPYEGFGEYNSITSKKISKAGKHSYRFGSSNRFKNTTLNTWENFSFTFTNLLYFFLLLKSLHQPIFFFIGIHFNFVFGF